MQHAFTIIKNHRRCASIFNYCLLNKKRSIPSNLLAVCCPVSDVLLLLFHAVFHPDATRRRHASGAGPSCGAHPRAAVRDEVMRPRVRASSVLGGVPAGAKLFLGGGAVLWRKTSPPAAAGHCERGQATIFKSAYSDPLKHLLFTKVIKWAQEPKSLCYWGSWERMKY